MKKTIFAAAVALAASLSAGNKANPDAIELVPLPKPVEFKSNIDSPVHEAFPILME